RRELGARLAPRDADLFDTVLLAPYPRHLGYENRLQLAGVQVTPTAHHAVVAGARCPALGARQRAGEVGKVDFHFAGAEVDDHIVDCPWSLDAEDATLQLGVTHPQSLRASA